MLLTNHIGIFFNAYYNVTCTRFHSVTFIFHYVWFMWNKPLNVAILEFAMIDMFGWFTDFKINFEILYFFYFDNKLRLCLVKRYLFLNLILLESTLILNLKGVFLSSVRNASRTSYSHCTNEMHEDIPGKHHGGQYIDFISRRWTGWWRWG